MKTSTRPLPTLLIFLSLALTSGLKGQGFYLDRFTAGEASAVVNGGESLDDTGSVSVPFGALADQRALRAQLASGTNPAGDASSIAVSGGALTISQDPDALLTNYTVAMYDSSWGSTPFDLAAILGSEDPTDYRFDLIFLNAQFTATNPIFLMDVFTAGGGVIQYAGTMSIVGAQTLNLGYLTSTGTPDPSAVIGFELKTPVPTGNGTDTTLFTIDDIAVVPEPASIWLLGLSGGGTLLIKLKRRRRCS